MSTFKPYYPEYLKRPEDEFGDELVEWLERYANGNGREERIGDN
ncbi:hypothetical protein [uncultured Microbacterium sp.]|nr:hypothetical protein [uncultured Microbacterium sp.]